MRPQLPGLRWFALGILPLLLLQPTSVLAQDDGPSLGDLARNFRKNKVDEQAPRPPDPLHPIIDNDNLAQVTEDVKNAKPPKQDKTVFSIDPSGNTLKVSSPDVTCSLSFNAKASALLIKPVLVEDLPLNELVKIDGPGSIQDENLQLEVFNGTDWDLKEITVGLTLERKPGQNAEVAARARVIPASENLSPGSVERRSDVTLLYHLKADAKPFSNTSFRENIGITPGPDEDWRWSIVEAKGIHPSQAPQPADWGVREEPLFAMPASILPAENQPAANQPESGKPFNATDPTNQASPATSTVTNTPAAQPEAHSDNQTTPSPQQ
jgi:hypothetical protein